MKTLKDLKELEPCESGYEFAASKNSLIEAWNTCERGDWMLWFAQKLGAPLPLLTLAKGLCAKTVMHLMHDKRSRQAVKVAIDFGNDTASRKELDAAAAAAMRAAVYAAYISYTDATKASATSASVATYAADACAAAASVAAHAAAARAASYAASSYAYADADADADAVRKENQLKTANICREILTDFISSILFQNVG